MKKCHTYSGFLGLAFIVLLATQSGCYYDKEELLYPGSFTCDTVEVKYSTTITSLLTASCYSCHAGSFPSGGIKLDTYADTRINALNGKLYAAVSHTGPTPMPQGMPKLSDCKIQAIKKWVDMNAPNN